MNDGHEDSFLDIGKTGPGFIALGKRLRRSSVRCMGMCPNWDDYPEEAGEALASAEKVYYPGPLYEQIFTAFGKRTFPRNYYHFLGNKIAQTNLFQFLGISHPKTRIYYGRNVSGKIEDEFPYPFVAKTPIGSSQGQGVFLIKSPADLAGYLRTHNPVYIQEYLPIDRDLRVVVVGTRTVHAYWRIHREGDFRNNVSQGGAISFEDIPADAIVFAEELASRCRFDEAGLDICEHAGKYYVIEANMVFGLEGFRQKDMDINEILGEMFDNGAI